MWLSGWGVPSPYIPGNVIGTKTDENWDSHEYGNIFRITMEELGIFILIVGYNLT